MGIPFQARPVSIIDSKGGHWCSPNDEYVLVHRAIVTGDTTHVVRRPYVRRPVSAKERTTAVASVKAALARYRAVNTDYDYSLIPEAHPVFLRLDADDAGRVWARLATGVGNPARFDVYDAGGRHVAALTTSIPFGELPLHIRGDYVYGVVKDQDGVPSVVRARIQRPGS